MRKRWIALVLTAALFLSGCSRVPGIVSVTAPPLPTATVLPTATPMVLSSDEAWSAADYNSWAMKVASQMQGDQTQVICVPALALSLHSLYWGGNEEACAELSELMGITCTRESQCVNAAAILEELRESIPDMALWFRMFAGAGVCLNESATGMFDTYFDTSPVLADLSGEAWSRDLEEDMAMATGGRISRDLSAYASDAGQTMLVSCAAYDVRWNDIWDENRDKKDSFFRANGEMKSAVFMRSFLPHEIYRSGEGTLAVLKMEDGLECWAVLPGKDVTLNEFLGQVDLDELIRWRSLADKENTGVAIPVLDLDTVTDFTALLRRMGLSRLTGAAGSYETIGRGFSGMDAVLQCSHLRFTHESGSETPEPTPTPISQTLTRPKEPEMLTLNRESLLLMVRPEDNALLYLVMLRDA